MTVSDRHLKALAGLADYGIKQGEQGTVEVLDRIKQYVLCLIEDPDEED